MRSPPLPLSLVGGRGSFLSQPPMRVTFGRESNESKESDLSCNGTVMKAEGSPKRKGKVDCVICTNIGFDENDLIKNGIELMTFSNETWRNDNLHKGTNVFVMK